MHGAQVSSTLDSVCARQSRCGQLAADSPLVFLLGAGGSSQLRKRLKLSGLRTRPLYASGALSTSQIVCGSGVIGVGANVGLTPSNALKASRAPPPPASRTKPDRARRTRWELVNTPDILGRLIAFVSSQLGGRRLLRLVLRHNMSGRRLRLRCGWCFPDADGKAFLQRIGAGGGCGSNYIQNAAGRYNAGVGSGAGQRSKWRGAAGR